MADQKGSSVSNDRVVSLPLHDTGGRTRTVFVRDYETHAAIGVYESEQGRTQKVRLNIDLTVQDPVPQIADTLDHVVCYDSLIQRVEKLLSSSHIGLVETLADQIAEIALEDTRVSQVRVRVEKLEAIPGATSVGVDICRHQSVIKG